MYVTLAGVVEISPSGVAPVCQEGDQLELMCSVTGIVLRWEFTVKSMTYIPTPITSLGPNAEPSPPVMIDNTTTFTFLRLSAEDSPVISRMIVNHVSRGLNGTVVNCREGLTSQSDVATTTILIIDPGQGGKRFGGEGIDLLLTCHTHVRGHHAIH